MCLIQEAWHTWAQVITSRSSWLPAGKKGLRAMGQPRVPFSTKLVAYRQADTLPVCVKDALCSLG